MMRSVPAWIGGGVLTLVVFLAVIGPFLGYDPILDVSTDRDLGPSWLHPLGTDHQGRDVAFRALIACQHFVWPGLGACAIALVGGVTSGALAGYLGGPIAGSVRYVYSVIEAVPRFVLVLLACSIWSLALGNLTVLSIAVGVSYAPVLGEAVHGRIEALRSAEYLEANRAHGVPGWRILVVHILWATCRRLIARHLLALFGYLLVIEATLSFLGQYGVQDPPNPSWGNMIAYLYKTHPHPHLAVQLAPIVLLWLVLLSTIWLRAGIGDREHG